jgi:hypothetical protein
MDGTATHRLSPSTSDRSLAEMLAAMSPPPPVTGQGPAR